MSRHGALDLLRIAATIEVVSFHCLGPIHREHYLFGFGIFVVVSVYLQVHARSTSLEEFVRSKSARLLRPWVAWGLFYVVAELGFARLKGEPASSVLGELHPLYFNQVHLWYPPFAFVALLFVWMVARRLPARLGAGAVAVLLIAASAAYVLPHIEGNYLRVPEPGPQWVMGSAAVLFAILLARALPPVGERRVALAVAVPVVWLALSVALVRGSPFPPAVVIFTNGWGLLLTTIALLAPRFEAGRVLRFFASISFGVFLAHPFVASALDQLPFFDRHRMLDGIVVVTLVTGVLVTAIRRTPLRAFT